MNCRPIIKRESHGRVPNDGNGMVGGRWWSRTRLGYAYINIEDILDGIPEDRAEKAFCYIDEKIGGLIKVEAYLTEGEDRSVGMSYNIELDESFQPYPEVYEAIDSCPYLTEEDKASVRANIDKIIDDKDGNLDYEFYDIDYPY